MKEFKGTPGPWSMDEYGSIVSGDKDEWGRAETVRVSGVALPGRVTEEYKANSRLVAAAPELLEALHNMVEAYQYEASIDNPALLAARAAIAKALGETK